MTGIGEQLPTSLSQVFVELNPHGSAPDLNETLTSSVGWVLTQHLVRRWNPGWAKNQSTKPEASSRSKPALGSESNLASLAVDAEHQPVSDDRTQSDQWQA